MSRPKKSTMWRTNVTLPKTMHEDLKRALVRRAALNKSNRTLPSFSAWVRDMAQQTIAAFK